MELWPGGPGLHGFCAAVVAVGLWPIRGGVVQNMGASGRGAECLVGLVRFGAGVHRPAFVSCAQPVVRSLALWRMVRFFVGFVEAGGIIVELFFLSNKGDLERYDEVKWLVASAIVGELVK